MHVTAVWARATAIDSGGAPVRTTVVEGDGAPDMGVVDELARWLLAARRDGWRVTIDDLAPELAELLDLAGLLGPPARSVEMRGQPEGGE